MKSCCVPAAPKRKAFLPPLHGNGAAATPNRFWQNAFVDIPGGTGVLGTDRPQIVDDGEGPARKTQIKSFRMSVIAVTNEWYAEFIAATGFITDAERFGWSLVFSSFADQAQSYQRVTQTPWWCRVDGADWTHPFGPTSSIDTLADHPVTHVSWNDAAAFAKWMGGRLPTEAEWEYAADGGTGGLYPWGDTEPTDIYTPCNIWQGTFPEFNTAQDGHIGTAPVQSFLPNRNGLFNMSGNVWEWSADAFKVRSLKKAAKSRNAASASRQDRVLKGGSYLCHKSYCYRYRIAARTAATPDSSTGHMGFRIVLPAQSKLEITCP